MNANLEYRQPSRIARHIHRGQADAMLIRQARFPAGESAGQV